MKPRPRIQIVGAHDLPACILTELIQCGQFDIEIAAKDAKRIILRSTTRTLLLVGLPDELSDKIARRVWVKGRNVNILAVPAHISMQSFAAALKGLLT